MVRKILRNHRDPGQSHPGVFFALLSDFITSLLIFLTADFEFLQAVFRRFGFSLTTTLKATDFIELMAVFSAVFRPI